MRILRDTRAGRDDTAVQLTAKPPHATAAGTTSSAGATAVRAAKVPKLSASTSNHSAAATRSATPNSKRWCWYTRSAATTVSAAVANDAATST